MADRVRKKNLNKYSSLYSLFPIASEWIELTRDVVHHQTKTQSKPNIWHLLLVCRLNDCYLFVTDVFVGPALIRGLAEVVERRPNDPIEYLATFLYKQVENTRAQKQVDKFSAKKFCQLFLVFNSIERTWCETIRNWTTKRSGRERTSCAAQERNSSITWKRRKGKTRTWSRRKTSTRSWRISSAVMKILIDFFLQIEIFRSVIEN